MNVKKCVMVCDSAVHGGGISAVMLQQAIGLRAAGIEVYVFAALGPPDPELLKNVDGVVCIQMAATKRRRISEIWNREAARAFSRYLKDFSVDNTIIHIHSLNLRLSPSIVKVLIIKEMHYVITAHDAVWTCPTGYFYNFQKSEYCELIPLSVPCIGSNCDKKSYLHKLFKIAKTVSLDYVANAKRDAVAIIAPSELLRQRLLLRVPSTTPVVTILNPINAPDMGPRIGTGGSFLFVGRIWEEKGIVELLEAIGNTYPLTVVGDGPRMAELSKLFSSVVFKGWMTPGEVVKEMRQSRALILPSIYLEAFGLVVAEALALGVPVIVSNRSGAASLVEHGVNGFVVDMGQAGELERACAALMVPKVVSEMSAKAYSTFWSAPLTNSLYIDELLKIFKSASST